MSHMLRVCPLARWTLTVDCCSSPRLRVLNCLLATEVLTYLPHIVHTPSNPSNTCLHLYEQPQVSTSHFLVNSKMMVNIFTASLLRGKL